MKRLHGRRERLPPRGDALRRALRGDEHSLCNLRVAPHLLLHPRPAALKNVKLVVKVVPRVEHPGQAVLPASLHGDDRAPHVVHHGPPELGRARRELGRASKEDLVGVVEGLDDGSVRAGEGRGELRRRRRLERARERVRRGPRTVFVLQRHDVPQVAALHPPARGEVAADHRLELGDEQRKGDARGHHPG